MTRNRHREIVRLAYDAAKRCGYPKDYPFMVGYLANRVETLEVLLEKAEKRIEVLEQEARQ